MPIDFSKYKGVLFDFDCTLYAPCHLGVRLVFADIPNMFLSKKERNTKKALVGKDFGNSEAYYNEFFRLLGEKNREWYFHRHLYQMAKVLKRVGSRPQAQELIDHLQAKGLEVGILSDYPLVKERCEAIGISLPEQYLWSTEDFGCLKPAPRPFIEITGQLGLLPNEILFIGDREDTDYLGAKQAGMDCILVRLKADEKTNAPVYDWDEIVAAGLAL